MSDDKTANAPYQRLSVLASMLRDGFKRHVDKPYVFFLDCKREAFLEPIAVSRESPRGECWLEIQYLGSFLERRSAESHDPAERGEVSNVSTEVVHVLISVSDGEYEVGADLFARSDGTVAFWNLVYIPTSLPEGIGDQEVGPLL